MGVAAGRSPPTLFTHRPGDRMGGIPSFAEPRYETWGGRRISLRSARRFAHMPRPTEVCGRRCPAHYRSGEIVSAGDEKQELTHRQSSARVRPAPDGHRARTPHHVFPGTFSAARAARTRSPPRLSVEPTAISCATASHTRLRDAESRASTVAIKLLPPGARAVVASTARESHHLSTGKLSGRRYFAAYELRESALMKLRESASTNRS